MLNANKNSSSTSSGGGKMMACNNLENRLLEDIHEEAKQDNSGGGDEGGGAGDDGGLGVREAQAATALTLVDTTSRSGSDGDNNKSSRRQQMNNLAGGGGGGGEKPKKIQQQTPRYQKQPSPIQRMAALNRSLEQQRQPSPSTYLNGGQYSLAASKRRQLSGNSRMRQLLIQNQRALNEIASGLVNPLSFGNENYVPRTTRAGGGGGDRATSITNQTFRSTSNSISSSPSTKLFRSNITTQQQQRTSRSVAFRSLNESMLVKCPFKQDQQRARSFTIMSVVSTSAPMPRVSSSNSLSNSRSEFTQRAGGGGGGGGGTTNRNNDSPSSSLFNSHSQNRANIATVTNAYPTSRTNNSPFNYQQKFNQNASLLPPNPSTELIIRTAKSVNDFVEVYEKSHVSARNKPPTPTPTRRPTFRDRKTSYSGLRPLNLVALDDGGPTAEDCLGILKEPKTSRPKYDLKGIYEQKLKLLEQKVRQIELTNPEGAQHLVKAHTALLAQLGQAKNV